MPVRRGIYTTQIYIVCSQPQEREGRINITGFGREEREGCLRFLLLERAKMQVCE